MNRSFDQPVIMAMFLGFLFLAGAAIGALSLILPHPSSYDSSSLWINVAITCIFAVTVLGFRRRLPVWALQLCVLAGTIIVTRAVYYGHDPSGYYTFWYLWIGVYAFFFFGSRWGAVQVGAVGAAYAWVLTEVSGPTPVPRWLVTVGSILVAGLLVDALAARLRRESAAAATRAENLEAVSEVARQLATQSDSRAVGWAICSAAVRTAEASAAVLWRPTISGDALQADAAAGADVEGLNLPFVTPGSGAIQVFTSGDDRFETLLAGQSAQELAPAFEAGAALWEPVLKDGAAVGVLAVYWRDRLEHVSRETRRAVRLLALEAAIAIERGELLGRLEIAARTDDLTGLLNRRAWDEELAREIARADRSGLALCVAILDLDRFKEYNDTYGHQAGDRFLKQLSGGWSQNLRTGDILARYGGEEFALALPGTNLEHSQQMLDRLREALPEDQTCSAGVCQWDGSETAEQLTARADTLLYAAKAAGRNRVALD
ncbi:MAG TPA: diguanylate cyclase [Solirubrobacterales bacterium]|nr:diguanylate cyclase [Solirubrobacterales bacterium]